MYNPYKKYLSKEYLNNNPSWDEEDSFWKAHHIVKILSSMNIFPTTICEVGCGAGGILASLSKSYPETDLTGYDIAPDLIQFWEKHKGHKINYFLEDFFTHNKKKFEVITVLDVLEHLVDPNLFLYNLHHSAKIYIFHVPLDICVVNLLRKNTFTYLRKRVGHVQYFTKEIAIELFKEAGYKVLFWSYSGISFSGPRRTWKTKLASIPRKMVALINKDFAVKLFGGESLWAVLVD